MRNKIVAGNWKMNNDLSQTQMLLKELKEKVLPEEVRIMVAPAHTNLYQAYETLRDHKIEVIAQNMHQSDKGAFTGEVSAGMLKSVGVNTVILGHSERRAYFNEDNSVISEKVNTALENGMQLIFCFGEELTDRKAGNHYDVVKTQLEEGLFHISEENWEHIILAYEPVWAIGTGETATPEQVQQMHHFIRETVSENYTKKIGDAVSILYGGSVKPDNAKEIFSNPDVDGGLIGGASLKSDDFMAIVNAFE